MFNAKMLYDFMTHFDLARTDVTIDSDGNSIWFEKPSGERWPLEFSLFEDGSYEITIFNDTVYKNGIQYGKDVILEKGNMISNYARKERIKDETNVQSHAKDA